MYGRIKINEYDIQPQTTTKIQARLLLFIKGLCLVIRTKRQKSIEYILKLIGIPAEIFCNFTSNLQTH